MTNFNSVFTILMGRSEALAWGELFRSVDFEKGMAEILGVTIEELKKMEGYKEWHSKIAKEL